MTDLDALIRNLEAATGPDRELSDRVLLACGWSKTYETGKARPYAFWTDAKGDDWSRKGFLPNPTASLDDALSLVPRPWYIECLRQLHSSRDPYFPLPYWYCCLERQKPYRMEASIWWSETERQHDNPHGINGRHDASTAPLAVCIAVLRARKESQ